MLVHINQSQKDQLDTLVQKTGIDIKTLLDEALRLFLARYEFVLRQDPYLAAKETTYYSTIANLGYGLVVDLSHSPGNAIADFLKESITLNTVSLSYVVRKSLALLFEGKRHDKLEKKLHI